MILPGPLEIINKINTFKILKGKIALCSSPKNFITRKDEKILLMKPNICFHRAGIPSKRKYTKLIMLQLNPSRSWKISKDLYKKQYKNEPKFTNISNLFTEKIISKNIIRFLINNSIHLKSLGNS